MARLRFGEVNDSDLEWAKGRHLSRLSSQEKALFSDAKTLFLVPKRADAHNLNLQRLQHFNQALQHSRGLQFAYCCPVRARDVGKLPKSIHEDVGGLPSFSVFCRGIPVTLCCNIVLPFRLFNGAVGTVVDFVFPPNQGPMPDGSCHPLYILVDFPDYSGPSLLPSSPTLVPVIPIEMHSFGCTRNGFPLKLSFCLTCHKAQGCTCGAGKTFERVCCNLGEGAVEQKWGHGLGFVALSRATEGGRVALDGDVSLTRLRAMTHGKYTFQMCVCVCVCVCVQNTPV